MKLLHIKRLLYLELLLAFVLATPSQAIVLHVQDVIEMAIQNNPDIGIVKHLYGAQKQRIKTAKSGYYPKVDITTESGWERTNDRASRGRSGRTDSRGSVDYWSTTSSIDLKQSIYNGQRISHGVAAEKEKLQASQYRIDEAIDLLALNAIEVYLDVYTSRRVVNLAKNNEALHKIFLSQMKERYDYKIGTEGDVEQARSRLYRSQEKIAHAKKDVKKALDKYERIVGVPLDVNGKLDTNIKVEMEQDLIDVIDIANDQNPSVLRAKYEMNSEESSQSKFLPEVDFKIGLDRNENNGGIRGPDNTANALISFKYNLYNGGADLARKRKSIAELNEKKERYRQKVMDIENVINGYWYDYNLAIARADLLEKEVESLQIVVKSYQEEFTLGKRSLLDVLDSQNELYLINVDLVKTKSDIIFNKLRIIWGRGNLLQELNLQAKL